MLYVPPDVFLDDDSESSAYCGPCAIAALLGVPLAKVSTVTDVYRSMNQTQAKQAVAALSRELRPIDLPEVAGMAHLFWIGPWSAAGPRVQYTKSHWVAYRKIRSPQGKASDAPRLYFYDVNAGNGGAWLPFLEWEREVLPRLLPKKSVGYRVNRWLELA